MIDTDEILEQCSAFFVTTMQGMTNYIQWDLWSGKKV